MTIDNTRRCCSRCVMDTSDPEIVFDAAGVCNHCHAFAAAAPRGWFPNEEGARRLTGIIDRIKAVGRGREYDCIIGLSGGVDSSYTAVKVHEWGLRPLVVHVDTGWNSELAVANIEKVVRYCGYHLHTHVVDWEEMRDLQLAYLRSGVANQDVPQDHVIYASLYHFAVSNGIRHVVSGGNFATEFVFPAAWHASAMDAVNLKAIHRRHGDRALRTYAAIGFFRYYVWYPFIRRMREVRLLNYMEYTRETGIQFLEKTVGWRSYGRKHGESIFTKLFQNHFLPVRFGYDKRRPHLSSMILSGQLTREEALERLREPLYEPQELERDILYFCKKMCITREQFDDFLAAPRNHYSHYRNWDRRQRFLKRLQALAGRWFGREIKNYS